MSAGAGYVVRAPSQTGQRPQQQVISLMSGPGTLHHELRRIRIHRLIVSITVIFFLKLVLSDTRAAETTQGDGRARISEPGKRFTTHLFELQPVNFSVHALYFQVLVYLVTNLSGLQVKQQFGDNPEIYNKFLDIMKDFKSHAIDTQASSPTLCLQASHGPVISRCNQKTFRCNFFAEPVHWLSRKSSSVFPSCSRAISH
jgi:hypothetical protein